MKDSNALIIKSNPFQQLTCLERPLILEGGE